MSELSFGSHQCIPAATLHFLSRSTRFVQLLVNLSLNLLQLDSGADANKAPMERFGSELANNNRKKTHSKLGDNSNLFIVVSRGTRKYYRGLFSRTEKEKKRRSMSPHRTAHRIRAKKLIATLQSIFIQLFGIPNSNKVAIRESETRLCFETGLFGNCSWLCMLKVDVTHGHIYS